MIARALACLLALLAMFAASVDARAHAYLVQSQPSDGDLLRQAPTQIELLFNEAVDPVLATHVDPQGAVSRLQTSASKASRIDVALPAGLAQGTHLVSWRVTSEDGHGVSGSVSFSIGRASGGGTAAEEPTLVMSRLSAPIVLTRFLLLAGLALGVGGAWFHGWMAPPGAGRAWVCGMLAVAAAAAVLTIGLQGVAAHGLGVDALRDRAMWRTGWRPPHGWGVQAALLAIALAGASLMATRRWAKGLSLAALAAAAIGVAYTGHSRLWSPQWLAGPSIVLHVAAMAAWAGALSPLRTTLSGQDSKAVLQRFSLFALPAYGLVLATGAALAAIQILAPRPLLTTAWGVALCVKLGLVSLVTALAAINRARLTRPVLSGDPSALRRLRVSIRIEAALALGVLATAAIWTIAPPPTAIGLASERTFQIHIHGVEAMASVSIRPARVGPVRMKIEPKSSDLAPLRVKEIDVAFTPRVDGVAPLRFSARMTSPDVWEVEGVTLPSPGLWSLRVNLLIDDFERVGLDAVLSLKP